jgi:uncharacterized protein (UPF0276 family)
MRTSIPPAAGLGLKPEHYREIETTRPALGWFEVHPENYMGLGGPPHRHLAAIREHYPLSLHGVGLSIGGATPLDQAHLARLRKLCDRYEPGLVSEHLAWSTHEGIFFNDLLPLPYTVATLARVADHIDRLQEALGRRILLENPSSYLRFEASTMSETSFLADVARRTGCGLLLDVNNVFVSAKNLGYTTETYIAAFPLEAVREIHLGGHATQPDGLLIDAHDRAVAHPVWALFRHVLSLIGPVPTLVEWDNDVPAWPVLYAEAEAAQALLDDAFDAPDRGARQLAVTC